MFPHVCTVEHVAGSIAFLASDEAASITGHNLVVDCAWLTGIAGAHPCLASLSVHLLLLVHARWQAGIVNCCAKTAGMTLEAFSLERSKSHGSSGPAREPA